MSRDRCQVSQTNSVAAPTASPSGVSSSMKPGGTPGSIIPGGIMPGHVMSLSYSVLIFIPGPHGKGGLLFCFLLPPHATYRHDRQHTNTTAIIAANNNVSYE